MSDEQDRQEEDHAECERVVGEHLRALRMRFDTVRIFVSRQQQGDEGPYAAVYTDGAGDWFSQFGQVSRWLVQQDQEARTKVDIHIREGGGE